MIEQKMENLHAELNALERNRKNQKDRAKRFLWLIRSIEKKYKTSRRNYTRKLKLYPNGKNK